MNIFKISWQVDILLIAILFSLGCKNCNGSGIKPYFEDINLEFINSTYIDKDTSDITINYKPDGKNSFNIHIDLIEDVPKDCNIKLDVSSRAFGHYVPTGLAFDAKLCADGHSKIFYDALIKPLGIDDCPPSKGSYEIEDFTPDFPELPVKLIPGSHLLADTTIYAGNIKILSLKSILVL